MPKGARRIADHVGREICKSEHADAMQTARLSPAIERAVNQSAALAEVAPVARGRT